MANWYKTAASATTSGGSPVAPGNVTLGTPQVRYTPPDAQGKVYVEITCPYTPPGTIGTFDRVHVYLQAPDNAAKAAVIGTVSGFIVGPAADASRIVPNLEPEDYGTVPYDSTQMILKITRELPAAIESWRLYAVSGSAQVENALVRADQASPTPNVLITVNPQPVGISGAEYAPVAATFTLTGGAPVYVYQDGGDGLWGYGTSWTGNTQDPRYPRLGGYDIVIEYPDGHREINSSPSKTDSSHSSDKWPVPSTPETYKVWLVSWDVDGNKNSIVQGTTPSVSFTVQRQGGAAGTEYTPNPVNPTANVEYSTSADGVELFRFALSAAAADDPRFGDAKVVAREIATGYDRTLAYLGAQGLLQRTDYWPVSTSITFDIYFVGVDTNTRENTLVPGITPRVAGVAVTPQTAGGIQGPRIINIPTAAFAAGIRPVELVGALPVSFTNYPQGAIVFLTTDNKLYRSTGAAWTKAVDGADLVANSVTAGTIAAGAIGTTQLAATEILVGQGGGKPTRFKVVDSFGNMICFIGDDSTVPFLGAYFKNIRIGPTIGSPVITGDATGVSINGAALTLNLNGVTTSISNTAFTLGTSTFAGFLCSDNSTSMKSVAIPGAFICADSASFPRAYMTCLSGYGEAYFYDSILTLKVNINGSTGNVNARSYSVQGTQVVTSRQTGPGFATGTLADVVSRFNSLIGNLQVHGLIT